jgi:hypothetical protein
MRALRQQVRFVPVGELSEPVVVSSSSWDRCRSPREIVGPKVDCDGRQAQSDADPENRRMMDRSSVARSRLHSITVRASSEGGTTRPSAFTVLRSITTCTPIAERPSPALLDQLGAKTSVLDVGYRSRLFQLIKLGNFVCDTKANDASQFIACLLSLLSVTFGHPSALGD